MIPIFLKGAAERWWNRTRTTAWTNDVNDNTVIGFQELFLAYFVGEGKRAKWQDQFENIRQGKKSIEEYNEEFIQKLKKADPDGTIPAAINIRKYIKSIKPEIAQAVYTEAPASLEEAMESAEKIQRGRDLIKGSSENYLAEIEDLRHQINMLKLEVNEPEIVEVSAAKPELNRPYNTNNNNNSRNWNNNNNNRNWNNVNLSVASPFC